MRRVIAIPSENPGGLDANLAAHFGHCDCYTLVTAEEHQISEVGVLPNVPHQKGGCLAPVQLLADNDVTALIAGGMGMRPLMGFNQSGIGVYFGGEALTVGSAVKAMLEGRLSEFQQTQTCGGCHSH